MIKMLKSLNIDVWVDTVDQALADAECAVVEELLTVEEYRWNFFLREFVERGRFEINTIEL